MAKTEARRQKQLARKKAKRQEKRSQYALLTSRDPNVRLASAESWPVVAALVPEELWMRGMGQLILARQCPDGRLACGLYLIDTYCLGVKNAHWDIMSEFAYDAMVRKSREANGPYRSVAPEYLAKIVQGALAYAEALGFAPHADFRAARLLLAGIDAAQCPDEFEFGRDGKPYYIQGPHDSPAQVRFILHQLNQVGGEYVVSVGAAEARQLSQQGGRVIAVE